jgi:hypothetical protein
VARPGVGGGGGGVRGGRLLYTPALRVRAVDAGEFRVLK